MQSSRLDAHRAVVGDGFEVRRALPNRRLRTIGAWCFLDHVGPVTYPEGGGLVIGPHPHIGLQTFTWMIEGRILQNDSLGFRQAIEPGQVDLMTAGRGIARSEDSPADSGGRFHLAQLRNALPIHESRRAPSFHHYPRLPVLERGGFRITVLAGEFAGERAPADVFTPLVGLDLAAEGAAETTLALDSSFEHGIVTLEGLAHIDGEALPPDVLLYLPRGIETVKASSEAPARLLVIGGQPLGENILLWWNFVGRSAEEFDEALADWRAG